MPRKNWSTSFINCNKSVRTHLGRAQTIGMRHWMVWLYIKMGNKIFDLYWWSFITYMCRLQLVKLQPLEWLHLVMSRKYLKRLVFVHNFTTCLFFSLWAASFHRFLVQVSLASDFMYNQMTKDVTASLGYDYILRQVSLFFLHLCSMLQSDTRM